LSKKPFFDEHIAAVLMKQLFSVLEYCHSQHVVHRDLKPENVMLNENNIENGLKVIDFGRSKILKQESKLRELAGSVCYVIILISCIMLLPR
jgi:serine/threonine protein kinase